MNGDDCSLYPYDGEDDDDDDEKSQASFSDSSTSSMAMSSSHIAMLSTPAWPLRESLPLPPLRTSLPGPSNRDQAFSDREERKKKKEKKARIGIAGALHFLFLSLFLSGIKAEGWVERDLLTRSTQERVWSAGSSQAINALAAHQNVSSLTTNDDIVPAGVRANPQKKKQRKRMGTYELL